MPPKKAPSSKKAPAKSAEKPKAPAKSTTKAPAKSAEKPKATTKATQKKPVAVAAAPKTKSIVPTSAVRIPVNPKKKGRGKGQGQRGGNDGGCSSEAVGALFAPVGSQLGYAVGIPAASQSASVPLQGSMASAAGLAGAPVPGANYQVIAGLQNNVMPAGSPFRL